MLATVTLSDLLDSGIKVKRPKKVGSCFVLGFLDVGISLTSCIGEVNVLTILAIIGLTKLTWNGSLAICALSIMMVPVYIWIFWVHYGE